MKHVHVINPNIYRTIYNNIRIEKKRKYFYLYSLDKDGQDTILKRFDHFPANWEIDKYKGD